MKIGQNLFTESEPIDLPPVFTFGLPKLDMVPGVMCFAYVIGIDTIFGFTELLPA